MIGLRLLRTLRYLTIRIGLNEQRTGSESSRVRKFQGAKVPHLELSLPGANGFGSEKSIIHFLCSVTHYVVAGVLA